MQELNLPSYSFRIKKENNKMFIYDEIRRKYVVLQPEEWVRQHIIRFLINEKKYPKSLINVEKKITINQQTKRYDIIVFRSDGSVFLVVECKAPSVEISQEVFDQIARYNMVLNAENLMVTNGIHHYFCKIDFQNKRYIFLENLPNFSSK